MKSNYNENYIKEAAYYNWQNAGCPSGKDEYFWNMAISQLYGNTNSVSTKSSSTKSCSSAKTCSTKKSTSKTKK